MKFTIDPFPPSPEGYREPGYVEPRMWKSLGHCMSGIEMHYGLERWHGEADEATEMDLKNELASLAEELYERGQLADGMVLGRSLAPRHVRFVRCSCGSNLYTTRN